MRCFREVSHHSKHPGFIDLAPWLHSSCPLCAMRYVLAAFGYRCSSWPPLRTPSGSQVKL